MNLTKKLVDKHKKILKVAGALVKQAEQARKGNLDRNFFEKAVFFIKNYADKFHYAKEEDILFKEICKSAEKGEMHCNPIEQMLYEHNMGREFVRNMEDGIKEGNTEKVAENALKYAAFIQEHIFKEDNILYPMAEESLAEKTKKEIVKMFEMAEKNASSIKIKSLKIAKELSKK